MEEIKLTHSTDEFDLDAILGGDCIFSIPYFQREYQWAKPQLKELEKDLQQIINNEQDVHFLGAFILYSRPTPAGRTKIYEVVDGQQRITTLVLILAALVEQFCILEKFEDAEALFTKYLYLGKKPKEISNLKLHPSKEDRNQFNKIILNLLKNEKFNNLLGDPKLNLLPSTGRESGKLTDQYKSINRILEVKRKEGFKSLDLVYQTLLKRFTSVQIILKDPTACSRIFERLNYRGVKVNIGDLVRNEIFSKVAEHPQSDIETIYSIHWEPFYKKFKSPEIFESYFFPYGIIKKPSLSKSEIFNYLRTEWTSIDDPKKIIDDLKLYQNIFLYLVKIDNTLEIKSEVKVRLDNLIASKFPSAVYPFLIQLIYHFMNGKIDRAQFVQILDLLDSFFTRRAICGIEPTGLHSVFRDFWDKVKIHPSLDKIQSQLRSYKTVSWPNNEEFTSAINVRSLYGSSITAYFILEYDRSLKGDVPNDKPTIEHILPKEYDVKNWGKIFKKDEHEKLVNTLGNLIPLSPLQNELLGQKIFEVKKKIYAKDSMYKTPRYIASNFDKWDSTSIKRRAQELMKFALKRWPY